MTVDPAAARRLRGPLLRWYRRAKRDLPWRRSSDPYAIWVSEVMLQQTTVAAVIPYWERFLERFPNPAALAASHEEDVLALWSGLGYYGRARALRHGAIAVMERHHGRVPETADALLKLPGIGRYTAGAIASLAFGREAPVVDGNVKRVFARLFGIRGAGAKLEQTYWSIAETLVRGATPGDWNQAVMELGATVCTPRAPLCGECPLSASCRARALGTPEAFPTPPTRQATRAVVVAVAWIELRGRVLLVRRREGGLLRGTWDLPAVEVRGHPSPGAAMAKELSALHGIRVRPGAILANAKHSILSSRLDIDVLEATLAIPVKIGPNVRWAEPGELPTVAVSGATTKLVNAVLDQRRSHDVRSSSASSGSSGRKKA